MDIRDLSALMPSPWEGFDEKTMIKTLEVEVDCYDEAILELFDILFGEDWDGIFRVETEVHCDFCVCSACDGRGSYVDPNIDRNGITAEDFDRDWDHDEVDAYFNGAYDIPCKRCRGKRVVPSPIRPPGLVERKVYDAWVEDLHEREYSARERYREWQYGY